MVASTMKIYQQRGKLDQILFFVRWQLWPILASLHGHLLFVARGLGYHPYGVWRRLWLIIKIIRVHLSLPCPHAPMELVHIVGDILETPREKAGAIVECGSYLGGSSAKLSLAAALSGRRLIICDSFEGLPEVERVDDIVGKEAFAEGGYSAGLAQVRHNIGCYGDLSVVDFIPGWYDKSLGALSDTPISCLFLDVDLQDSIKTCLTSLWGQVQAGCKVFVHDVDRSPVVEPFRDQVWWQGHVGPNVPPFFGALTGLGRQKPLLGYAVKE